MTAFLFNSKREKQGGGMNRKAANKKQRASSKNVSRIRIRGNGKDWSIGEIDETIYVSKIMRVEIRWRGILAEFSRAEVEEFARTSVLGAAPLQRLFGIHVLARPCRQNLTHGQLNTERRVDESRLRRPKTRPNLSVLFLRLLFRKKKWMECCANLLYAIFWK